MFRAHHRQGLFQTDSFVGVKELFLGRRKAAFLFLRYTYFVVSDDLKKILEGEVAEDAASLKEASRDASIFELKPQVVVYPKTSHDLQLLVQYVSAKRVAGENISLTARAAGTDMSGGPLTESISVSFLKYFNRIKSVTESEAVAEPGVFYRDLEKQMDKLGVFFPSYPASKGLCAIGGMVANNAGGEKTLTYGKTAKHVKSLKVILRDGKEYEIHPLSPGELEVKKQLSGLEGELYTKLYDLLDKNYEAIHAARPHVSKNSAGYALWDVWDRKIFDLTKLFVGSQGTLGFVTEATLGLMKKKSHSRLAVIFVKNLKTLSALVPDLLRFKPESLESYDRHTLYLALKFLPDLLKVLKNENLFSLALGFLPEFFMALRGGFPELVILAEVTGESEEDVKKRAEAIAKDARIFGLQARVTRSRREAERYWAIRRESFNLLRKRVRGKQTAPFIDDIIVPPEKLPEFLPKLNKILNQYSHLFTYTIAGHVGDGNFHIIPLMDLNDHEARKIIPVLSDEVYDLVLKYGGSITAEHNDGLIRSPYLQKMFGEKMYALFEEVKNIFDPLNVFNPGKKVGSDLQFALAHIKHPK